jgi:hypothetical protein
MDMLQNPSKPIPFASRPYFSGNRVAIAPNTPQKNPAQKILRDLTRGLLFVVLLVISGVILAPLALLSGQLQGIGEDEELGES